MSAKYDTRRCAGLWRAVCRAARALGRLHAEQVHAWEALAQANRASVPAEGPLRWVSTLDGRRLAGRHLPASSGISAGETP
jgi:hypothetical protein